MQLVRWRIRTLMAVVATVAVLFGVAAMQRRSQSFRLAAEYHFAASHQLEMECRSFLCGYGIPAERLEEINRKLAEEQKLLMAASEYHRVLTLKYQSAAARPWMSIGTDPPAPPKGNPAIVSAADY